MSEELYEKFICRSSKGAAKIIIISTPRNESNWFFEQFTQSQKEKKQYEQRTRAL